MSAVVRVVGSLAFAGIVLSGATPGLARTDDKDVIDYRRHVMKLLNEQSGALGEVLSGAIPNGNVTAHLEAIALTAATALKAFEPNVPGGQARPQVWANWADFSSRMNEFAQKTALMAKIAKEQGQDAALPNVLDVLTCKSCHDVYRDEKNGQ